MNLNIIRPAKISGNAKLPVLFVSAFDDSSSVLGRDDVNRFAVDLRRRLRGRVELDVSLSCLPRCERPSDCSVLYRPGYNGTAIVQKSIEMHEPVIYVALNYRLARLDVSFSMCVFSSTVVSLSVFGFLGGKEVQEAGVGNLGLQDRKHPAYIVSRDLLTQFRYQNALPFAGLISTSLPLAETRTRSRCKFRNHCPQVLALTRTIDGARAQGPPQSSCSCLRTTATTRACSGRRS